MFIHIKKLNEGSGKVELANKNISRFYEGKNPKNRIDGNVTGGWQETESSELVNQHWAKLRK